MELLLIAVIFLILNFTESRENEHSYLYIRSARTKNSQIHSNLRKEPLSKNHVNLTTLVKTYGYYETVSYEFVYDNGTCYYPLGKMLSVLNTCAPSAYNVGQYYQVTVLAYPEGNTYYWYDQFFEDNACTVPLTDNDFEFDDYILICENHTMEHVIAEPLNPQTDNLSGFALLLYNTQQNCTSNNYLEGVYEAIYGRLNVCFEGANGDEIYISCSSSQLIKHTFTTSNATCLGDYTTTIYSNDSVCMSGTETLTEMYAGWVNYQCEPLTQK